MSGVSVVSHHGLALMSIVPSCSSYKYRMNAVVCMYLVRTIRSYDTIASRTAVSAGLDGMEHNMSVSHYEYAYQLESHIIRWGLLLQAPRFFQTAYIIVVYRYVRTAVVVVLYRLLRY